MQKIRIWRDDISSVEEGHIYQDVESERKRRNLKMLGLGYNAITPLKSNALRRIDENICQDASRSSKKLVLDLTATTTPLKSNALKGIDENICQAERPVDDPSLSSKKQPLRDMKNVVSGGLKAIAPFKSEYVKFGMSAEVLCGSKYSRNQPLAKEHVKKKASKVEKAKIGKEEKARTTIECDVFECSDFPFNSCSHQCLRPDTEIWAEMSMISDSALVKLLSETDAESDIEDDYYMSLYKDEDVSIPTKLSGPFTAVELDAEECLFHDPLPELPEMDELPVIL